MRFLPFRLSRPQGNDRDFGLVCDTDRDSSAAAKPAADGKGRFSHRVKPRRVVWKKLIVRAEDRAKEGQPDHAAVRMPAQNQICAQAREALQLIVPVAEHNRICLRRCLVDFLQQLPRRLLVCRSVRSSTPARTTLPPSRESITKLFSSRVTPQAAKAAAESGRHSKQL